MVHALRSGSGRVRSGEVRLGPGRERTERNYEKSINKAQGKVGKGSGKGSRERKSKQVRLRKGRKGDCSKQKGMGVWAGRGVETGILVQRILLIWSSQVPLDESQTHPRHVIHFCLSVEASDVYHGVVINTIQPPNRNISHRVNLSS
jgi:hypothetical protein